jgi:hypothetical protein
LTFHLRSNRTAASLLVKLRLPVREVGTSDRDLTVTGAITGEQPRTQASTIRLI